MNFPVPWRTLLPADALDAIVGGPGGHELRAICDQTGACVDISGEGETPATLSDKICTISGSVEQKEAACRRCIDKLRDQQGVRDQEPGVYVIIIPAVAAPMVVGQKGSQIKEVIELSGAEISLGKENILGMQDIPIGITGSAGQVVSAVSKIHMVLQDVADRGRLQPSDFKYRPGAAGGHSMRMEPSGGFRGPARADAGDPRTHAKLVVATQVAGWIIGKQGRHIRELQENSGAHIHIRKEGDVPPGVSPSDRVVEIGGMFDAKMEGIQIVLMAIDSMPALQAPREIMMLVPRHLTTEAEIKDAQQMSGSEIEVRDLPGHDEGLCTLLGTIEARVRAARQILTRISESLEEGGGGGADAVGPPLREAALPAVAAPAAPAALSSSAASEAVAEAGRGRAAAPGSDGGGGGGRREGDPWSDVDPWSRSAPAVAVAASSRPSGAAAASPPSAVRAPAAAAAAAAAPVSAGEPAPEKTVSFGATHVQSLGDTSLRPPQGGLWDGRDSGLLGDDQGRAAADGAGPCEEGRPRRGGEAGVGGSAAAGGTPAASSPAAVAAASEGTAPRLSQAESASIDRGSVEERQPPAASAAAPASSSAAVPPASAAAPPGGGGPGGPGGLGDVAAAAAAAAGAGGGRQMSFGAGTTFGSVGSVDGFSQASYVHNGFGEMSMGGSMGSMCGMGNNLMGGSMNPLMQSGMGPMNTAGMGGGMYGAGPMMGGVLGQGGANAGDGLLSAARQAPSGQFLLLLPSDLLHKALVPNGHLAEIARHCQIHIDLGDEVAPSMRLVMLTGPVLVNAMAVYHLQERAHQYGYCGVN